MFPWMRQTFIIGMLCLLLHSAAAWAAPKTLHHDIRVSLIPKEGRITGKDAVRVAPDSALSLLFVLSKKATVSQVLLDGESSSFTFAEGQLQVPMKNPGVTDPVLITITYAAVFDDPVPEAPLNMDNPGFGIAGLISERGSFLQAGSGWYPEIPGSQPSYSLRVMAPAGILALSAGESLGHQTEGGMTVSEWQSKHPIEGLSLSAGPYTVRTRDVGKVKAMTYFLETSDPLSRNYLDAIGRYLSLYEDLIGPYPFEKFAVVENFFPTGYGFPSYTLLGSAVLRLPFIIETSLGHEIAHCWWGNGVLVDFDQGNWCEGLTTYLSDYLYKERASEKEAQDYRLQILRNFTTLVNPENDFPLKRFQGRSDPASQAIGYGKGAFVFHMLRQRLGEKAFWNALREVYRNRLFQKTSWQHFQDAFEHQGRCSLRVFFDQWLSQKGAPRLYLQKPQVERLAHSFEVQARVEQLPPFYELELPVLLRTRSGDVEKKVLMSAGSVAFLIPSEENPERLAIDPEVLVFRYLDPRENPPSINTVKASPSVTFVLAEPFRSDMERLAGTFALALGLGKYRVVSDEKRDAKELERDDLILMGFPRVLSSLRLPPGVAIEKGSFAIDARTFDQASDVLFGVFSHPQKENGFVAIFHPLSLKHAEDVIRKITHYGRYSYLVFREGQNLIKGTWPVTDSPLIYSFDRL